VTSPEVETPVCDDSSPTWADAANARVQSNDKEEIMFRIIVLVAVVTATVIASIAYGALPGRVVASKSATGQFAVTATTATVKKPKGVWVNLIGKGVDTGLGVIACTRDFTVSSNSKNMKAPGLYRLPILPVRADTCHITASVGGSGRVTVQIRASR
jgi:hypothetical protein